MKRVPLLGLLLALACSSDDAPSDSGSDSGSSDGGVPDGGPEDAGPEDTGVGVCGDLEAFDWRDAVMYFAMVDRFADGDGLRDPVEGASDGDAYIGASGQYEGGDLKGLGSRLPYLSDLGVNALWITSVAENKNSIGAAVNPAADNHLYTGYHGYWPHTADIDWSDPDGARPQVESRFGTAQDLRDLIAAAHGQSDAIGGHGIKVLADYVMNHVDDESPLYLAHRDWFATDDAGMMRLCGPENLWDHPTWGTRCAFTRYLPAFDFERDAPRAWSVQDATWWATEFEFDGFRLDAIKHVPSVWLTDVVASLHAALPNPPGGRFYLVGETFTYSQFVLSKYIEPGRKLDGQFDFPMRDELCKTFFTGEQTLQGLASWMKDNDDYYAPGTIMASWIGNHDIPRPIHFANGEIASCRSTNDVGGAWTEGRWAQPSEPEPYERLALAYAVMMTNPGIPTLYYGDELGLAGGPDPDNRRMMPWEDDPMAPALLPPQVALREKVRALARMRGAHPVLSRGQRETLVSDTHTWVYRMTGCDQADVVVALNRDDETLEVELPTGSYTDLLAGGTVQGGTLALPPRSYRVLEAE